ncbi:hypothetical protein FACS1894184_14960 [Clostridia bacterium]|nr:hypothetical protein FACS1894184_14960 [Clostridia bacterium]
MKKIYYKKLIGQKFGKWFVLDAFSRNNKGTLRCQCDCGRIVDVDAYSIVHGGSSHCRKCNTYIDEGAHMRCMTSKGASFIIDKSDTDLIKRYTWYILECGYATATVKGKTVYLHKLLGEKEGYKQVDHINQDKSDNRRCNLRPATHMQNQYNKKLTSNNTSGYKGVCFDKRSKRYIAYIDAERKRTYLGYYEDPISAALAYDQAAVRLHGEFAYTNIIGREQNERTQTILELVSA